MNKLAERLKYLREEEKLNQRELAKKLNVSQPAIARWETNKTIPNADMVIAIAKYFKVSTDYLLDLED